MQSAAGAGDGLGDGQGDGDGLGDGLGAGLGLGDGDGLGDGEGLGEGDAAESICNNGADLLAEAPPVIEILSFATTLTV